MSVCRCGYEYLKVDKWPLILCCTYDPIILNIVSKVAFEHKIRVWHSTSSSDIMAIPCDIAVINRNTLGRNGWTNYTSWLREIGKTEETLFVFLDNKLYKKDSDLFQIKSFHQDFNSDYKSLYNFLNTALQQIIKEKCLCDLRS